MKIGLHEFRLAQDGDALAALLSATRGKPVGRADVAAMMQRDASLDDFRALITDDGTAYARTFRQPWFTVGLYGTGVTVRPDVRRRGIGTLMLAAITDIGRSMGATAQIGAVGDGRPEGMGFALSCGFVVDRHMSKSVVDPASVDPGLLTAPLPEGITIASLAALGDTEANRRTLWKMCESIAIDFPNDRRQPRAYEQFGAQLLDVPGFRPAGAFVALNGKTWVGAAMVGYTAARNALYHHFTGVDPAYRGRGIATALRRATIAYAIETGASILETHNDSTNAPILAINRAFGYRSEPGVTDLYRTLARSRRSASPGATNPVS